MFGHVFKRDLCEVAMILYNSVPDFYPRQIIIYAPKRTGFSVLSSVQSFVAIPAIVNTSIILNTLYTAIINARTWYQGSEMSNLSFYLNYLILKVIAPTLVCTNHVTGPFHPLRSTPGSHRNSCYYDNYVT